MLQSEVVQGRWEIHKIISEPRKKGITVISKLKCDNSKLITNPKTILSEQRDFYKELYSSRFDKNIDDANYKIFFLKIKEKLSADNNDNDNDKQQGILQNSTRLQYFAVACFFPNYLL